jgi:probable O-glycosylation ligase (exosortase A-associated)
MRDLLLIAAVLACTIVAVFRPVFGLLVYTGLGFLNPQTLTWGAARHFPVAMLVGAATIAGYAFSGEPKKLPRQRELTLLLLLWIVFGISTMFAIEPANAKEWLIRLSKILIVPIMCTVILNTDARLRALLLVISLSLGVYAIKGGGFAIASGGNHMVWGPENTFLAANNSIGMAHAMNVPLLIFLSRGESRRWLKWLMWAMVFFSYPAVVCTFSRGAWIALGMVTVLLVMRSRHKFVIATLAGILLLAILPVLPRLLPERVVSRYGTLKKYDQDSSALSRFWNWEMCKRVGMAHPLTGGGFDFYSLKIYAKYYPEFLTAWPGKVWQCHSMWFTMFAEHGFPGFILWIALIVSCFLSLHRLRRAAVGTARSGWIIGHVDMLESAFVAYMAAGSFLDIAYFDMFYYLVAVLIVLKERVLRDGLAAELSPST